MRDEPAEGDEDSEDAKPAPYQLPDKPVNVEVGNTTVPEWVNAPPTDHAINMSGTEDDIICPQNNNVVSCLGNAQCAWWQQRSPIPKAPGQKPACDPRTEVCGSCHRWNLYQAGDVNECRQYKAIVEKKVLNEIEWGSYCGSYFGYECKVICPGQLENITKFLGPDPLSVGTPEGRLAKMREDLQKHCEEHDWIGRGCIRDPTGALVKPEDVPQSMR